GAELLVREAATDRVRQERLAALKERLDAESRDQEFIARFEEIRLRLGSHVNVKKSRFAEEDALPEIRDALRRYGIKIGVMATAEAAARVQARPEPVRRYLVAALTEFLKREPRADSHTRRWVFAVLAAADKDAWRVRVRKAVAGGDWVALEQLTREVDLRKQPPNFLLFAVARNFPERMSSSRLEFLRRIQRAYPADWIANSDLGLELRNKGQPGEAVRYFTAALALRPENPGIYLNRGTALRAAGELDAAIADYRQAL